MIVLVLLIMAIVIGLGVVSFFFGAHTAGSHWQRRVLELQADLAEREAAFHRLSVEAMTVMADEIDRLRDQ